MRVDCDDLASCGTFARMALKEFFLACYHDLGALARRPEATFALALFVSVLAVWQIVIMRRQEQRDLAHAQVTVAITDMGSGELWRSGMLDPVEIPASSLGSLQLLVSNHGNAALRQPRVILEGRGRDVFLVGDAFTSGGGTNRMYRLQWMGPHFPDLLPISSVGAPYAYPFGVRLGEGVSTCELVIRVTGEGLASPQESVVRVVAK